MDETLESNNDGFNKIVYATIIFVLGLVGGLLPQCVRDVHPKILSLLNMGSGGVFLAASILHILPDAAENIELKEWSCNEESSSDGCEQTMPWAFFFFGVGFLMILSVEAFAHRPHCHRYTRLASKEASTAEESNDSDIEANFSDDELYSNVVVIDNFKHIDTIAQRQHRSVALVVLFSLSFHSIMEGLAIGSQTGSALDIFLAIIAHKSLAAFALGIELVSHGVQNHFFTYILLFSLMTPLGILIGWLSIMNAGPADTVAGGICTALSGGTFLYVATIEIISRELHDRNNKCQKVAALCIGFSAFGILAIWV